MVETTRSRAWRLGIVGIALAACGVRGSDRQRQESSTASTSLVAESTWSRAGLSLHGVPLSSTGESIVANQARVLVRLPLRSSGAMRVERRAGVWVEQRALDVADVAATLDGDRVRFDGVASGIDVVHLATRDGFEDVRIFASASPTLRARYRLAIGDALTSLRAREGMLEALDASGRAWLRSPRPIAVDARGVRRLADVSIAREGSQWSVTVTLTAGDLTAPIALDPGWFATTSMATLRASFTATPMTGGKVLVTGGNQDGTFATAQSSVELFDPATKTFTSQPAMSVARARHAAVLLGDGRVLVAGGGDCVYCDNRPSTPAYLASTEIFDGTKWTPAGAMSIGRADAAFTLLSSGGVLAAGGSSGTSDYITSTGEVWASATGKWTAVTNTLASSSASLAAVALPTGKALVLGGYVYYTPPATTNFYDPTSNSFLPGP
ncbi:MAG: hypothetical protein ACHREM_32035, partial [Polyangiales bacterium]